MLKPHSRRGILSRLEVTGRSEKIPNLVVPDHPKASCKCKIIFGGSPEKQVKAGSIVGGGLFWRT